MPGRDEQGIADPPPADHTHARQGPRRGKRGEARIPPAVAVLVAVALYPVLPEPLLIRSQVPQQPVEQLPLADLRFTQDETQDTVIEVAAGSSKKADWIPTFVDYLYLSTPTRARSAPPTPCP